MNYAALALPVICCLILIVGLIKKVDVFSAFVSGAGGSWELILRILPYVVGMVFAIDIFKASGIFEVISNALGGISEKLGIPSELIPVAVMRPFSGGASIGLLSGLLARFGADSFAGNAASVYIGSSDTLMYTVTLYLGSVGIKKTRYIIPVGIICDVLAFICSCLLVRWLI